MTSFHIDVKKIDEGRFTLTVVYGEEEFDCGNYISRGDAMKAGIQFVNRKEGEEAGQKKRPRRKD